MGLLLVSGVNRSVSRRMVRLRGVLAAVLGDVGGHLPLGALVALALGITAVLAFSAAVARAEPPRLIPDGQFESEGAVGVAVDQSTSESDASRGDVYVGGFLTFPGEGLSPGRVSKFDPSGNPLSPPSPIGEAVYYSGAAVNPQTGDVYALGSTEIFGVPSVFTYDPASGELLGSFPVEPASGNYLVLGSFPTTVVGIATDSSGNVYVPVVPANEVLEYSPEGKLEQTFTGGSGPGELKGPTGVAVDPAGNVWAADAGNERIVELSPSGAFVREIASEGVRSVAVDAHGDVFALVENAADFCGKLVPPCSHLLEYGPSGAQIADVGAGTLEHVVEKGENLPKMLAVSDATGRVYVTDSVVGPGVSHVHGRVFMFTPPVAPTLESEVAVEVGVSEAKLGAVVNPGGISASYRFEYGTTTAYGGRVPFPEGDTGGGFKSRTVWAAASGLQAGTTYHYRVVVTSELGGELMGEDKTFTTKSAAQAGCPNEQFRTGFSVSLPDCRAYELVTPPNETSAQPDYFEKGPLDQNFAALDGNRMAFKAIDVLPGSPSAGSAYVATRGATGWSSQNEFPPQNYYGNRFCPEEDKVSAYSLDLSKGILQLDGGSECGGPEPELVPGEPKGVNNLYLRDNASGSYQLINMSPPGVTGASAHLLTQSADLSHVLFEEQAQLTPDALPGVSNVYEWSGGTLRLFRMLLPDGTPVAGSLASISRDGSRVFFTYAGALYAQSAGSTVQIDASQAGGPGGGGGLLSVSADGSKVLLTDDASAGLTADTVPGSATNIYTYDFASARLSDLTPAAQAEVQSVTGVSEDLSHVYFQAQGALAAGATQGQPNAYLWNAGTTTLIQALGRASANGEFQVLATSQRLTAYDNTDANTGQPDSEIYLYSAATNTVVCASCNPSGQRPTGGAGLEARATRSVSNNGQVFFDSSEALLPADTNGQQDTYEFEAAGAGSCGDPAGCLSLLSTGTGSRVTRFIDASASGSDVFLLEYQKLLPVDKQEEARAIYDVRVGGGIPEATPPPACATADACRTAPAPQPPIFAPPASQSFTGAGNLLAPAPALNPPAKPKPKPKRCRKGYVKKKGRCVKAKKARKAKKTNRKGSK